jgi:hypothetical protein
VVLWAKTDIWYVQPLVAQPFTVICGDGSWRNWTHPFSRLAAVLVDTAYEPGATRFEHPASDAAVLAWDEFPSPSGDRVIEFSGYSWNVKDADLAGPGPNYFSDSDSNVWIDTDGLHLKIAEREGRWYCAEVFLDRSLGYGEYTFQVASRIDSLDDNVVFAGFIYESLAREVDIEFSQALARPDNAQFVVQPYNRPGNIVRFEMPPVSTSSHRFLWREDRIEFTSWRGYVNDIDPDSVIYSWTYTGTDIPPPGGERMRFNLWLFAGQDPSSGEGDEVIVRRFQHEP